MDDFLPHAVLIIGVAFFIYIRKSRTEIIKNPSKAWKLPEFKEFYGNGYDMWIGNAIDISTFKQKLQGHIFFPESIDADGKLIQLRISGDYLEDPASFIEFLDISRVIAKARVTKSFFRAFDFELIWDGNTYIIPLRGDITKSGDRVGHCTTHGIDSISIFVYKHDMAVELRTMIIALKRIHEVGDVSGAIGHELSRASRS